MSNTNTSSKEKCKNKDNHKDKKNEKSSKERKQETKETSTDQNNRDRKGKPSIFIMGDSMVKKLYSEEKN